MKTIIIEVIVMGLFFWVILVPLPLVMQGLSDTKVAIEVKNDGR